MKAYVIFDSRFGNTKRIANAVEAGLQQAGVQTARASTRDVPLVSLREYDLLCVGAPTEGFSASKAMKEFLARLAGSDISGKYGFAYDTRIDWRFSGSAAKFIEKTLIHSGLQIIAPCESAIVSVVKQGGAIVGARLDEGEEERFVEVGKRVGIGLASRIEMVQA